MEKLKLSIVFVFVLMARTAGASPATEQARCITLWGASGIYPTYLIALSAGRYTGFLRDREYTHGLLNDALKLNDEARKNSVIVAGLTKLGPVGAAALLVMWNLDVKCLKAGVDFAFRSAAPAQIAALSGSFEYLVPDGRRCTASSDGTRWRTSCSPDGQDWLGYMGGDCHLWWSRMRITDEGVEFEHRGPGNPPGGNPEKLPINKDSVHLGFIDPQGQGWHVYGLGNSFATTKAEFTCPVPAPQPPKPAKRLSFEYSVDTRACVASIEGDRWKTSCSPDLQTWIGYRGGDCNLWWSKIVRTDHGIEFEHRGAGSPPKGDPEKLPQHSRNVLLGFFDPQGQGWHVKWDNELGFVLTKADFGCKWR